MKTSGEFCTRSRKWRAKWIWMPGVTSEKNVYYYFRREIYLEAPGRSLKLFVAADTRYQLFINGRFIGRGAPQSQPFYQYYDEYETGEDLEAGVLCVAAIVNHTGRQLDARGGFLLEVEDGDGRLVLATDRSWRVRRADAWQEDTYLVASNQMSPYQEFFDARLVPDGWTSDGFDDGDWKRAETISGRVSDRPPAAKPWSCLVPRDIPFMDTHPVLPERIERVEESLDLTNRSRPNDLAPGLSMVGGPLTYTRIDNADDLTSEDGATVVQGSTMHEDLDFDGVYAPAVVLDFGRVITARAHLVLTGCAGGVVDIGYAERLIDGQFNIAMECEFADRYVMTDGLQEFEAFNWRSFRFLKLRFRSCPEAITVHSVHGAITTYPYEDKGQFNSSDETLNAVFRISRDTLRLCSNECLMDTPWREQAQWLGDVAMATVPAVYACFGDTRLPSKFIRQSAHNQHPTGFLSNISNVVRHSGQDVIPDYSLWWVRGLWYHYWYTGEADWIHRYYPEALRVYHAHLPYINDDGLIEDMPYWVFIDWADTEKRGECAAYNAIFYASLESLYSMARLKNDSHTEEGVDALMRRIEGNFHEAFYDDERGCYADARIDGRLSEKISENANMAAVCFGLCDDETAAEIIRALYETRSLTCTEAQPFFTAVVLRALDRAGRFDLALNVMRDRWGKRMVAKGATSVFEEWYQNGSWRTGDFHGFLRSHSHAWSACPAEILIKNLMGIEILEAGCGRVSISPKETDFDYRAAFPTPRGNISVKWAEGRLEVDSPDEVTVARA